MNRPPPVELPIAAVAMSMLLLGVGLYFAVAMLQRRGSAKGDLLLRIAWLFAVFLIYFGLTTAVSVVVDVRPGIFLWFLITAVIITSINRYYNSERRVLLHFLEAAVKRGMPLATAMRAFSAERFDILGRRVRKVAQALEQGVPLPEALKGTGKIVPNDVRFALEMGASQNNLEAELAQARERELRFDALWLPIVYRALYLAMVVMALISLIFFILIWVVPTNERLYEDFMELNNPATKSLIAVDKWLYKYPWTWLPFAIATGIGSVVIMFQLWMRACGYLSWEPVLLGRFLRRLDTAVILRTLAAAIDRSLPLPEALQRLSLCFPRKRVRFLLGRAANEVAIGQHWTNSLLNLRLLSKTDAALLQSAAEANNLAWAMREVADSAERRFLLRASQLANVVYPFILTALGVAVGFIVFATLAPLSDLILYLA